MMDQLTQEALLVMTMMMMILVKIKFSPLGAKYLGVVTM
jgi:hypothetical protein